MMNRLNLRVVVAATTTFAMLAYLMCVAFQPLFPDWPMYASLRWQESFPGFGWTLRGVVIGLLEVGAYAASGSATYVWLYNAFAALLGSPARPA
jgi:hypothetical protein